MNNRVGNTLNQRIISWLIYFSVFLIPLLFTKLFFNYYVIKFYYLQTVILILFFLYFREFFKNRLLEVKISLLVILWVLFLLAIFISSFYSVHKVVTLKYWYKHFTGFLFFIIIFNFAPQKEQFKTIVIFWIWSSSLACIYGIVQYAAGSVPYSTFGNKNIFSAFIILVLPVSISSFLHKKSSLKVIAIALHFLALYVTDSRAALLGGILGFIFYLFILLKRRRDLGVSLLIVLFLLAVLSFTPYTFIEDIIQDIRFFIWKGAVNMISRAPFFGFGAGTFFIQFPLFCPDDYYLHKRAVDATRHAHCELLEIGAELGLIGLGLFLTIIIYIFYKSLTLVKVEKDREVSLLSKGLLAGFFSLIVHNLLSINLRFPSSLMFFYLTPALILARAESKKIKIGHWLILILFLLYVSLFYLFSYKPLLAQYYFRQGIEERNYNNLEKAIYFYEKSIEKDPLLETKYRLAFTYAAQGDLDKSLKMYNNILKQAPGFSSSYRNAGIVAVKKKDILSGVEYFKQALKQNPYDLQSRNNLIVAYYDLHRKAEAEGEIRKMETIKRFLEKLGQR